MIHGQKNMNFFSVLLNDIVFCNDYIMMVVDECMSIEYWWDDTGETQVLRKNLSWCHTLDQKST